MFVSSYYDRRRDLVQVWERHPTGRKLVEYKAPWYFYVPDPDGKYTALTGQRLARVDCDTKSDFENELIRFPTRFESDFSPLEKVMMDNYQGKPAPELVVGFIDIEVDYDPTIGFSGTENPYAPISAITIYRSDLREYITLAVPPRPEPVGAVNPRPAQPPLQLDDTYVIFTQERELLEYFLSLIDDVDLLSGWNSEFFDLPYIGKRIELLFGQAALKRLGFDNGPQPWWGEHERFKNSQQKDIVLNLGSRVHLDYLQLFKKFNLEGRQSYSLANIADDELNIPKLDFGESLYDLYRNNFENFLKYNRRDVEIIVQLDKKFKYIGLANQMVHEATVNFHAVLKSVQLIDTAITNFCHAHLNLIIFDKPMRPKEGSTEGALVLDPKVALVEDIGSIDIKSLYPSLYRALNLSPEKVIGQVRVKTELLFELCSILQVTTSVNKFYTKPTAKYSREALDRLLDNVKANWIENKRYEAAWRAVYRYAQGDEDIGDIELELFLEESPGEVIVITVVKLVELLRERKYAISAHGTLLDQSSGEGLIPAVLSYWFNGRIDMQLEKKRLAAEAKDRLKVVNDETDEKYLELKKQEEYFDMLQGVRKVLLNSTYGATLNEFCRFFDGRLGSSTTDSGRQVTSHMLNTVAECLMGDDAPKVKKHVEFTKPEKAGDGLAGGLAVAAGEGIANHYTIDNPLTIGPIYSDTDSAYFSMKDLVQNDQAQAVEVADLVAANVNGSFPGFLRSAFFCQPGFDNKISVAREIVATRGIFRAKKKYVLKVIDKEGFPVKDDSKDELKTQGSDIKLSSTPEKIREFLKTITLMVLRGKPKSDVDTYVLNFREKLTENSDLNILEFATVSSVKELDDYYTRWERIEKAGLGRVTMSAAARGVINHNELLKLYNDQDTRPIMAGQKIKMIWLEENAHGFTNIAFSSETEQVPKWFTDNLKPDIKLTELKLVDAKLRAIFEPIGWEIPTQQTVKVGKLLEF